MESEGSAQTTHQGRVSQERVDYLWRKLRVSAFIIGRFLKLSQHVTTYGVSTPHYSLKNGLKKFHTMRITEAKCLILPHSRTKQISGMVMSALLLWSATITPYRVSFETEEVSATWDAIETFISFVFACDIIICFISAYYDSDNKLVIDRRKIAWRYARTWFIIDLISWYFLFSFPSQLMDIGNDPSARYNSFVRILRLPRLYRLLRIFRLFKTFQLSRQRTCAGCFLWIANINPGVTKLLRFVFLFLLLSHVVACLWFFTARLTDFDLSTWVVRYNMLDRPVAEQYIASLYFVLTTLATVGYGDIVPFTMLERSYAICLLTLGVGFYSYSISNFSTIMSTEDKKNIYLSRRLETLSDLVKVTKLPFTTEKKVKSFLFHNSLNKFFLRFDQEAVMKELPAYLRTEISLYMYHGFVQKVFFFQDKDPTFIASVAPSLKSVLLQKGDLIYREHDFAEEVFFVTVGRINFEAKNGKVFKTFVQGSYFGEIEIMAGRLRMSTARVQTETADLLVLPKRKFLKMLDDYPKIAEEIRDTALLRSSDQEFRKSEVTLYSHKPLRYSKQQTVVKVAPSTVSRLEPIVQSRLWNHTKNLVKKQNFRKMWKRMDTRRLSKDAEEADSKWDYVLRNFIRPRQKTHHRKSIISAGQPSWSQTIMRSTLLERFLKQFPAVRTESSKWNKIREGLPTLVALHRSSRVIRMSRPKLCEYKIRLDIDTPDYILDEEISPRPIATPRSIENSVVLLALKMHRERLGGKVETLRGRVERMEGKNREMRSLIEKIDRGMGV